MYIINLKYSGSSGHFLEDGEMLLSNKSQRALMEYAREQDNRELCGFGPAYIYAYPETGSPILIEVGD